MTQYPLTVFFDGACPICACEIALMKRLDRRRQQLEFCDFSRPDYDAVSIGFALQSCAESFMPVGLMGACSPVA